MKITRTRLQKILNNNKIQTKKNYKQNKRLLNHTNTFRNKRGFNLRTTTLKNIPII